MLHLLFIFMLKKERVSILVGKQEDETVRRPLIVEGTDDPESSSVYTTEIRFDDRLI